jgi:hypothetical protein
MVRTYDARVKDTNDNNERTQNKPVECQCTNIKGWTLNGRGRGLCSCSIGLIDPKGGRSSHMKHVNEYKLDRKVRDMYLRGIAILRYLLTGRVNGTRGAHIREFTTID